MKLLTTAITAAAMTLTFPALAHKNDSAKTTNVEVLKESATPSTSKAQKHSGGTDSKGCHTNHKTGKYHCHKPK